MQVAEEKTYLNFEKKMRKLSDYDEGDDFNSPYISGFDIVYEKIIEDMEEHPYDYPTETHKLFKDYEEDPILFGTSMMNYIEDYVCGGDFE